jgi:serine/threonine protein kinase
MNTLADKDTVIGTPFWMSPEIISKSKYNKKTDIWYFSQNNYKVIRNNMY